MSPPLRNLPLLLGVLWGRTRPVRSFSGKTLASNQAPRFSSGGSPRLPEEVPCLLAGALPRCRVGIDTRGRSPVFSQSPPQATIPPPCPRGREKPPRASYSNRYS